MKDNVYDTMGDVGTKLEWSLWDAMSKQNYPEALALFNQFFGAFTLYKAVEKSRVIIKPKKKK